MQTSDALLRILKLAEKAKDSATTEDHIAADVVRSTILALRMGISITGNMNRDYSNPF